jgi:hypothetical protein
MTSGILAGIERWPLDQLISYVRNARTHSEDQVAQIAASIIGVSNRSQLENKSISSSLTVGGALADINE